ncbi:MAG: hypothetical protein HY696_07590 [Deltaproteobacteria bacterium]|nr:hypothetical protein [Deltaproteobacteria bacterium]
MRHPRQLPAAWRTTPSARPPFLLPRRIRRGLGAGWQLITTQASPLFPGTCRYLLPPEPVLAAVLDATVYSALLATGIVTHPRETLLPVGFCLQRQSAVDQLYALLHAYCPIPLSSDQWADTPTIDGGLLINVDGTTFILHQEALAYSELSPSDLEAFARLGLIAVRRATRTLTAPAPQVAFQRRPRARESLDLETFAIAVIERWSANPILPVVPEAVIASPQCQTYPQLCAWLMEHRAWLECQEVERMRSLLRQLEVADATSQQQGILDQVAGLMAEVAVRPILVRAFQACLRRDPNAILLLSHQIADAAGQLVSDAVIVSLTTDQDGALLLLLHTIYEITLAIEKSDYCSLQLRRARDDRYQEGLYIRNDHDAGCLVPVRLAPDTALGLELHVVPDDTAATIRSIITDCRARAVTRFRTLEWGIKRTVVTQGGHQAPAALRPTILLSEFTSDTFNDWARQIGSDTVVFWGGLDPGGSLTGFAVGVAAPAALSSGHFAVTMVRDSDRAWRVTDAIGAHLPRLIPLLRRIPDLKVPSAEWLGRGRVKALSAVVSIDQSPLFAVEDLERWAGREEWDSRRLVVTGNLESDGRIVHFAVSTTVPVTLPEAYFQITCERDETGTWQVRAVGGHHVDAIVQALRAIPRLKVPSNEWLSRAMRYTFSQVTSVATLARLTTASFAQWADEWGTPIVTLVGIVNGTRITGFAINPRDRVEGSSQIVLTPLPSGAWEVLSVQGHALPIIVPVLRQIPGVQVPSNEWLSRSLPYTLSAITSTDAVAALTTGRLEQWEREWSSPRIVLSGCIRGTTGIAAFRVTASIPADLPHSYFCIVLVHDHDTGWRMVQATTGSIQLLAALRSIPDLEVPQDTWLSVEAGAAITRFDPGSNAFRPLGIESLAALAQVTPAQLTQWAHQWGSRSLVISGGRVSKSGRVDRLLLHPSLPSELPDNGFTVTLEQDGEERWHVRAAAGHSVRKVLAVFQSRVEISVPSNELLFRDHRQSFSAFNTVEAWAHLNGTHLDRWADDLESHTLVVRGQYAATNQKISGLTIMPNTAVALLRGYFSLTFQRGPDGRWCLMDVDGRGLPPILKTLRDAGNVLVRSDEWLGRHFTRPLSAVTTIEKLRNVTPGMLDCWAEEWGTDALFLSGMLRKRVTVGSFKVGTISPAAAAEIYCFIVLLTRANGGWCFKVRGLHTALMRDVFSAAGYVYNE